MSKPFILGITGGSGSGKTRFMRELRQHFTEDQVCLFSQDNYYRPRHLQSTDAQGYQNFDEPDSMDLDKMVGDVKNLIRGNDVILMEYTYNNPDITSKKVVIKPAPVIVLEGLFIMYRKDLRDLLDLKVFVHAMEHIMMTRRIIRDEKERGYDLNDVLYRYQHHVMPSFRKYILPYREECDIVINNNRDFKEGLHLVTGYLDKLLRKTIS